jgi:hypothetical protein
MKKIFFALGLFLTLISGTSQNLNLDSLRKNFKGYKVPTNVKSLGSTFWKRNSPVMIDLVIQTFQKPLAFNEIGNQRDCIQGGWGGAISGDFNNDGWIDVFTPGGIDSAMFKDRNRGIGFSFLIWDSTSNSFKDMNLLNNKNLEVIISPFKVVPVYLNSDDYIDMVIFPSDDDKAPIKLIVSDGKGRYDYSEIITNENDTYGNTIVPGGKPSITKYSGDVADLNEDGIPDIYIPANNFAYILWGLPNFPFFDANNHPKFVQDTVNFSGFNNNGFDEKCVSCTGVVDGMIFDVNKDGKNDILVIGSGSVNSSGVQNDLVLINKGKGRFNDQNNINIPRYVSNGDDGDYIMLDINGDNLNDFIVVTGGGIAGKNSYNNIYAVIQKTPNEFIIDTTLIQYSNLFRTKILGGAGGTGAHLFSYDFNKDGKLDIGYINSAWGDECGVYDSLVNLGNIMPYKTVFIREGDKFIEKDYYQYDPDAKYMLTLLRKRFICAPENLPKPNFTFSNSDKSFCKNDSLKVSVNYLAQGSTLTWNYGKQSLVNSSQIKYFSDTTSFYVTMINSEFGCSVNSDKISLSFKSSPPPPIVRDTAYCVNTTPSPLLANTLQMHDVYWSDQLGMRGAKFTPTANTMIAGQKKFYVTQVDLSSNCASVQSILTVNIEKAGNAPIVKDTIFCQNSTSSILSAKPDNGNYLLWYTSNQTGVSGSKESINATTTDTTTKFYYVSQATNLANCESPRAKITVKINPSPAIPSVKDTSYCNNINADTLKATPLANHSLSWYGSIATGGTASTFGSKPNTATTGTFSYYVSQISNATGCEGARAKIGVTINPLPNAPSVRDTFYCNNASVDTLRVSPTTGNTILWYGTSATGGTSSNTAIKPITSVVGTSSYYLSQITSATGCESLRSKLSVTIHPIPLAPILSRDTANNLISNVGRVTWFKDGTQISDTTQKFKPTSAGSYSVKTTQNGCISAMSSPYYYLVTDIVRLNNGEFIKLTPNPFINFVNIDFLVKGHQRLNIEVFSASTGAKVATRIGITAGSRLTFNELNPGIYFIRVATPDMKVSHQFKMVKL